MWLAIPNSLFSPRCLCYSYIQELILHRDHINELSVVCELIHFFCQKIERLQSNLHLLNDNEEPCNRHTIFVDSPDEGIVLLGC